MSSRAASRAGSRRRWWSVDVALLLLALGLLVAVVLTWRSGPEETSLDPAAQEASSLHRDAVAAAGAETLAFLEVDHDDMDAVVDRVLDGATGEFREEYAAGVDRLTRSVERREATVTAKLRAVGLTDVQGSRAVALVAADSVLVDRQTGEDATLRKHRLRLELERTDGEWLVSGLEFVR